jgi:RNA polymerase sigma-70 factor (ECF subfamily)
MDLVERSGRVASLGVEERVESLMDSRDAVAAEGDLAAALAGDADAFQRLVERYLRELHLHCYRMLGSFHDAEDGVQETLLRAWRYLPSYEGRSSLRAWLYRIATNVCLTRRPRRAVEPLVPPKLVESIVYCVEPVVHLSPYPDALLDEVEAVSGDPAAAYDLRESVQLAFLTAVQLLPPRQRAVLILHDVVGFSGAEVAEALDSTVASVNSALGRARTTIAQQRASGRLSSGGSADVARTSDEAARSVATRYVEAWQAADVGKLIGLLRKDVVMTMPPRPVRYVGREFVVRFLVTMPAPSDRDRFRFILTRANRQPALAAYRREHDGDSYRAWAMFVLCTDGETIAEIKAFGDSTLLPWFGLPGELDLDSPASPR